MTVRIGVVGLGFMGRRQAECFDRFDAVTVVGGIDTASEAREKFTETLQAPAFETMDEFFATAGGELDAVSIVTPHAYHYEQARQAIATGVDLLVEKPLAMTLSEIDDLIRAARENDRIIQVGYHRRFHPAFRTFRKFLDDGLIGQQRMITGSIGQSWVALNRNAWRMDPDVGGKGGYLTDTGSHLLDGLLWLADGQLMSVSTDVATSAEGVVVNAAMEGTFETATRTVPVTLSVCGESMNPDVDERLTIWGTEGRIIYEKDHRTAGPDERLEVVTAETSERIVEQASYEELTRTKLDHFIDAIQHRTSPEVNGTVARRIAAVRKAALDAAERGDRVNVQEYRSRNGHDESVARE
jgi:predicted dehydrogenase